MMHYRRHEKCLNRNCELPPKKTRTTVLIESEASTLYILVFFWIKVTYLVLIRYFAGKDDLTLTTLLFSISIPRKKGDSDPS